MKTNLFFLLLFMSISCICSAQYNNNSYAVSLGLNYSNYLGTGEGGNSFTSKPGVQAEFSIKSPKNFEWMIWGIQYFTADNYVGDDVVQAKFTIPYYTEFMFFQPEKKNPLFFLIGFDYVRMKFPDTEKPDSHYNITAGAGINIRINDKLYLQTKAKPYVIIDNSIGQQFGINILLNFQLGFN